MFPVNDLKLKPLLSLYAIYPLLAGTVTIGLICPSFAETMSIAAATTPVKNASEANAANETVMIEPQARSTEVLSLQVEPGTGNLVVQTSGAFLAPSLDVSEWPNRLTLHLLEATLDSEFGQASEQWLQILKTVYPQTTAVKVEKAEAKGKPEVLVSVSFQGLDVATPKPKIIANTGALVTVAVRPTLVSHTATQAVTPSVQSKSLLSLVNLYRYFVTIDPAAESSSEVDGLVKKAWADFLAGNPGSAILALKPYVERVPEDVAARYLLASAYLVSDEPSGAEKQLKALLIQNQASLPLVLDVLRVKLLASQDDVRQDREFPQILQQALKRWPNQPSLLYNAARYSLAKDQLDDAKQHVLSALEQDAQPQYYTLLGDIELKQGNAQAARVAYWDALAVAPDALEARQKLAMMDAQQQKVDQALKQYNKTLSPAWLLDYASVLQANNQSDDALAALKMADLALGNAQSFAMVEQNKSISYELGMRFAEYKENADAQRNLKLFLDLANLKPDPAASESAKRVLAAKEALKRLETATPMSAKTPVTTKSGAASAHRVKLVQPATMGIQPAAAPAEAVAAPAKTPDKTIEEKPSVQAVRTRHGRMIENTSPRTATKTSEQSQAQVEKQAEKTLEKENATKPVLPEKAPAQLVKPSFEPKLMPVETQAKPVPAVTPAEQPKTSEQAKPIPTAAPLLPTQSQARPIQPEPQSAKTESKEPAVAVPAIAMPDKQQEKTAPAVKSEPANASSAPVSEKVPVKPEPEKTVVPEPPKAPEKRIAPQPAPQQSTTPPAKQGGILQIPGEPTMHPVPQTVAPVTPASEVAKPVPSEAVKSAEPVKVAPSVVQPATEKAAPEKNTAPQAPENNTIPAESKAQPKPVEPPKAPTHTVQPPAEKIVPAADKPAPTEPPVIKPQAPMATPSVQPAHPTLAPSASAAPVKAMPAQLQSPQTEAPAIQKEEPPAAQPASQAPQLAPLKDGKQVDSILSPYYPTAGEFN